MRDRYIRLFSYKRKITSVTCFDRWQYVRKNWFTDQLWKALHKLGCLSNPIDREETFYRVEIDTDSVGKAVLKAMDGIYYMHGRPKQVYMGPDEFDRHMSDKEYHREMTYNFTISLNESRHTMFDLPVEVVPHMEGLLVV